MKSTLKAFLLLSVIAFFSSCGDDPCTQSDWVGTYTGTVTCDGNSEEGTVTITANGTEEVVIRYSTDTQLTEYDPLTPTDCTISLSQDDAGITVSITATLDGDNLTINESFSVGGTTSTCNVVASR